MRAHDLFIALSAAAFIGVCAVAQDQTKNAEPSTIPIEDWASETFALPPDFAPDFPAGVESLLFSPGWRDPNAEDFWSYTFVIWIDEPQPDSTRVKELLESYYDGLMSVFARKRYGEVSIKPAQIAVNRISPNQYEAQMHLIDAFATFKPIDVHVKVETAAEPDGDSIVRIMLSAQPMEHEIWRSLEAANRSIRRPVDESKD